MRAFIFTLPAAVLIASVYQVQPPQGIVPTLGFLLGTFLSFMVYSQLNLLVGLTAAFTEHAIGVQRAKNAMVDLLGGVLIPLTFFPDWVQVVLAWLPFGAITYTPVAMYLGELNVVRGLLVQLGWAILLFGVVRFLWRRALDHLTVQGG